MNSKINLPFKIRSKQKILRYKYKNSNIKIWAVKGDVLSSKVPSD